MPTLDATLNADVTTTSSLSSTIDTRRFFAPLTGRHTTRSGGRKRRESERKSNLVLWRFVGTTWEREFFETLSFLFFFFFFVFSFCVCACARVCVLGLDSLVVTASMHTRAPRRTQAPCHVAKGEKMQIFQLFLSFSFVWTQRKRMWGQ
jgi:hypothetical protein